MAEKEKFSLKAEIFDWFEAVGFSIVVVILIFTFFFRSAQVDGNSMLPTLQDGDRLVLLNTAVSGVSAGDIVVITQPTAVGHPIIKRVIATEGQVVNINFETGGVYVDDILLEESYINDRIRKQPSDCRKFPITVGPGKVFVMGDNRNASTDSRNEGVGEIDTRYIMGKAVFRLFPLKNAGTLS